MPLPAGNPAPDDGAEDVPVEITLAFDPGIDLDGDRLSYDIHFGTENPPPFVGNRPSRASTRRRISTSPRTTSGR